MTEEPDEEDEDYEEDADGVVYLDLDNIFQEHYGQTSLAQEEIVENENEDSDTEITDEPQEQIKLPYHVKCPCHLLNLIATTDISKITNPSFKKLKKKWIENSKKFGTSNLEVSWLVISSKRNWDCFSFYTIKRGGIHFMTP